MWRKNPNFRSHALYPPDLGRRRRCVCLAGSSKVQLQIPETVWYKKGVSTCLNIVDSLESNSQNIMFGASNLVFWWSTASPPVTAGTFQPPRFVCKNNTSRWIIPAGLPRSLAPSWPAGFWTYQPRKGPISSVSPDAANSSCKIWSLPSIQEIPGPKLANHCDCVSVGSPKQCTRYGSKMGGPMDSLKKVGGFLY